MGIVDTATVAADPAGHGQTVYVGGANGYLYALSATDLSLKWKSVIAIPSAKISDYFEWSSPTVANGKVYIGASSHCDNPLIRGGVIGYRQASGKKFAEFYTVPRGSVGGSVWSSLAVASGGDVYATTGNGPNAKPQLRYSESIVKLAPDTLKPLASFKVPKSQVKFDADFGASPTIFGRYVGACNKNGIFYAVRRSTMRLAWELAIAGPSALTRGHLDHPGRRDSRLNSASRGQAAHQNEMSWRHPKAASHATRRAARPRWPAASAGFPAERQRSVARLLNRL
jgi:outer membrane protein assembly factor BamB